MGRSVLWQLGGEREKYMKNGGFCSTHKSLNLLPTPKTEQKTLLNYQFLAKLTVNDAIKIRTL